ncbi:hypothetical protein LCGC14_1493090 [marine sediment metagenome]|uniref:Rho termination factor N-terminal domain-containing protein n=1 Tax=marine sediment metagenome TaxID=412755 RepID=A0A0F9JS69_9ZZZZ
MPCETVVRPGPAKKPQETPATAEVEAPDWSDYSVADLKEECAGHDLKGYSKLKRPALEAVLNAAGATPGGE